ncbi:AAA family ATPase [Patescibacteria group bacterium]|nr:AAA family ATPase [Patescibacteria group bacterium]
MGKDIIKKLDWQNIVGHDFNKKIIENYINQKKLPHSIILSGVNGVGKKLIARHIAKMLMCQQRVCPCGQCQSCVAWEKGGFFGSYVLEGESQLLIDQVRTIKADLSKTSYVSDYRVVVMGEIERLTRPAANCLLKVLEEPGKKIVFLFTTGNIAGVVDTIVSRSTVLRFGRLSREESLKIVTNDAGGFGRDEIVNIMMGKPLFYDSLVRANKSVHVGNVIKFWRLVYAGVDVKQRLTMNVVKSTQNKLNGLYMFWESCIRDFWLWKNGIESRMWWKGVDEISDIHQKINLEDKTLMKMLDGLSFLRRNMHRGLNRKVQLMNWLMINN